MDLNRLNSLSNIFENRLRESKKEYAPKFSIENYIDFLGQYPQIAPYNIVSNDIKNFCNKFLKYYNKQDLELFHKLTLIQLIKKAHKVLPQKHFPEDILSFFDINFNRILKEIESNAQIDSYSYKHDKFHKDLSLCCLRLIPAGTGKININNIAKRFLFKGGLRQLFRGIFFVSIQLRGFGPFFEFHVDSKDPHLLKEFNKEGNIRFYKRISELFELYPHVKGIYGKSWLADPVIESISPRLAFMTQTVTKNGGIIFCLGSSEQSIKDATLKSKTRRKLYQKGEYLPTSYLLVWPRKSMQAWARKKELE